MEFRWPIIRQATSDIIKERTGLTLFKEMFGALSDDPHHPLSRASVANSSFSIDPAKGCPMQCAYCVVGSNTRDIDIGALGSDAISYKALFPKKISILFETKDILEKLIQHPAFVPNKSVISIGTGSTEAFLGIMNNQTQDLYSFLIEKGYTNPVRIVTKGGIPKQYIGDWRNTLCRSGKAGIKTVISISYSGMPKNIEPYTGDRFSRYDSLTQSYHIEGLHISHHLRPILKGVNDSDKSIEKTLKTSLFLKSGKARGIQSICIGGLRKDPGIALAREYAAKLDPDILPEAQGVKDLPENFDLKVGGILQSMGVDIPIFEKSSQVISYALGKKDYNLYEYRELGKNAPQHALLKIPSSVTQQYKTSHGTEIINLLQNILHKLKLSQQYTWSQQGEFFCLNKPVSYQVEKSIIHAIGHEQVL